MNLACSNYIYLMPVPFIASILLSCLKTDIKMQMYIKTPWYKILNKHMTVTESPEQ